MRLIQQQVIPASRIRKACSMLHAAVVLRTGYRLLGNIQLWCRTQRSGRKWLIFSKRLYSAANSLLYGTNNLCLSVWSSTYVMVSATMCHLRSVHFPLSSNTLCVILRIGMVISSKSHKTVELLTEPFIATRLVDIHTSGVFSVTDHNYFIWFPLVYDVLIACRVAMRRL